jgi:hypothetical protein
MLPDNGMNYGLDESYELQNLLGSQQAQVLEVSGSHVRIAGQWDGLVV